MLVGRSSRPARAVRWGTFPSANLTFDLAARACVTNVFRESSKPAGLLMAKPRSLNPRRTKIKSGWYVVTMLLIRLLS